MTNQTRALALLERSALELLTTIEFFRENTVPGTPDVEDRCERARRGILYALELAGSESTPTDDVARADLRGRDEVMEATRAAVLAAGTGGYVEVAARDLGLDPHTYRALCRRLAVPTAAAFALGMAA